MMNRANLTRDALVATLAVTLLAAVASAQPRRQAGSTAESNTGVAFEERRGWKLEAQGGVFTAIGGRKAFSNAQPYVGVSLAMDLGSPGFSLFVSYAQSYNGSSCRSVEDGVDPVTKTAVRQCADIALEDKSPSFSPDSFSLLMPEVGVRYRVSEPLPRLGLYAVGVAGATLFSPALDPNGGMAFSPHAGLGIGVAYVTRLDSLNIGAELLVRSAFTPLVPSLSFYPRLQYTF